MNMPAREGDDAERHHPACSPHNEEELRGREAQRKDQVARNHVGEQSDRQRERADNQQLKQLNRGQQNIDRGRERHSGRSRPSGSGKALFTDAGNPVLAEAPHGEHQRQRDGRGCRDVEARDDAAQIEDQQRAEHGGDHRHITLATQLAHHLIDDVDRGQTRSAIRLRPANGQG